MTESTVILPSPWLSDLIAADTNSRAERTPMVAALAAISFSAKDGAWNEIDAALTAAPVSKMSSTTLMTLVRGTFRFKNSLKNWGTFRDAVAAEFIARDLDVSRLMTGLMDEKRHRKMSDYS